MSKKGIKIFSGILTNCQQARIELLNIGTKRIGAKEGNQDIRLAQMLEEMKDCIKDDFAKVTSH